MLNYRKCVKIVNYWFCAAWLTVAVLLTLTVPLFGADRAEDEAIYFVQITDTRFGEPRSEEVLKKIIKAVNNPPMEIECVIHAGDITQEKMEDSTVVRRIIELFGEFEMPVYFVPGNHDIFGKRYFETKQTYIKHFGSLSSVYEHNSLVFLLLFTEPLARGYKDESFDPLYELEANLRQVAGKSVIVCHHAPCVDDFYSNRMHPGWKEDIRKKWIELLNEYKVKAALAGHLHRDGYHWPGDVPLYVCSPVSAHWGRQPTFRIYEYKKMANSATGHNIFNETYYIIT